MATIAVADLADSYQLHQPLRERAVLGHRALMRVVLLDALVEVMHFAEQVADDEIARAVRRPSEQADDTGFADAPPRQTEWKLSRGKAEARLPKFSLQAHPMTPPRGARLS